MREERCPKTQQSFIIPFRYFLKQIMRTQILRARFAVRKSKPGMGHGLFATSALRKGDFILEYKGRRIPTLRADASK